MREKIICAALVLLFGVPQVAKADRRNFVWSYEAKTMSKGESELEYYFTTYANKDTTDTDFKLDFNHDIEIEYGITDRLDVALYQLFRHNETQELRYRGYKVRGRYRLAETGEFFVDPLVYLEFIHKPFSNEVEFEEKLVLAKNAGPFVLAFNMTMEQELKYKTDTEEYKFAPSLAVGYQPKPWVTVGAEFMAHMEATPAGGYEHTAFLLGPTVSLAGRSVWWSLGALVQATKIYDEHARFQVRSLLGLYF